MSQETREWLSQNTLIGFTEKRGNAWHYREGDDNHFEGAVPRERVVELLDFPLIEANQVVVTDDAGVEYQGAKFKGIVRADTGEVFHMPRKQYQIHQPIEWTLEALDDIYGSGLEIGSVVVLKGGALVSVQAEFAESRQSAEGVVYRPFLNATTANDGSMSTRYYDGAQLTVCDNTLALALKNARESVFVTHRSGSSYQASEVRRRLGIEVEKIGDAFDAMVKDLTSQFVSDATWRAFVDAYTGVEKVKEGRSKTFAERKVGQLERLWRVDPRVAPWKNSAYGVLTAVNTATQHVFGTVDSRPQRNLQKMATGGWAKVDNGTLKLLASVS